MSIVQYPDIDYAIGEHAQRIRDIERSGPGVFLWIGTPGVDLTPPGWPTLAELIALNPWPWNHSPYVPFLNSWTNDVSDADKSPMRIRVVSRQPTLHMLIEGDVTGGANGTEVFESPERWRPLYSTPLGGHDDAMLYVACRWYSDGRFVRGVV